MTYVFLTILAVALLSGGTFYLWRRRHRARQAASGKNQGRQLAATGLDRRFWLELAIYCGGFALGFYLLFGQALSVYLGYGDLS